MVLVVPAVDIAAVKGEGSAFELAVDGWVALLSAAMVDPTAAEIVGNNPTLKRISFRLDRLAPAELAALGAVATPDDPNALLQASTGVRIVCDALTLRLSIDALEHPARIHALQEEAKNTIAGARAFLARLQAAACDDHVDLAAVSQRVSESLDRLVEESRKLEALSGEDLLGAIAALEQAVRLEQPPLGIASVESAAISRAIQETPFLDISDQCFDEWIVVLTTLRLRAGSLGDDLVPMVQCLAEVVSRLWARFGDSVSPQQQLALKESYERWLAAVDHSQAADAVDEARRQFSRLTAQPDEKPRERESPAEEARPRAVQRTSSVFTIEPHAQARRRQRRMICQIALFGLLVAGGVTTYQNYLRPAQNFATIDPKHLWGSGGVLLQGYLVKRGKDRGHLFVGQLRKAEGDLADGEIQRILDQVRTSLRSRGITEVLLMDRYEKPVVTWKQESSGRPIALGSKRGAG